MPPAALRGDLASLEKGAIKEPLSNLRDDKLKSYIESLFNLMGMAGQLHYPRLNGSYNPLKSSMQFLSHSYPPLIYLYPIPRDLNSIPFQVHPLPFPYFTLTCTYLQACQLTCTCWVNATVASSSEIWPEALALLDVSAMRLFTFKMPLAPHGDQMTDAVGTWSCFVYTWPSTHRPPPSIEVRVVVCVRVSLVTQVKRGSGVQGLGSKEKLG